MSSQAFLHNTTISGTHRYFFKLYALDTMLNPAPALEGHILVQAELMGPYQRSQ